MVAARPRVSRTVLLAFALMLALPAWTAACFDDEPRAEQAPPRPAASAGMSPAPFASPQPTAQAPARDTARPAPPQIATGPALELTPLGHTDLDGRGFNGSVRALGGFAYVGSWGSGGLCPALGVRVVDISDPAAPRMVATAARYGGTSAEDIVPRRVDTPSFRGDLLVAGIQRCGGNGRAGLALWDVTDPLNPAELSFFDTGVGARGVHELDVTEQGGRVLALLAVPFAGQVGDFRIVDITDPRNPAQLSSWSIQTALGAVAGTGCNRSVYGHSARASADGRRAYLSYWDAGMIILDISDPTTPRFVGRAFEPDAEGAVHSVDEMAGDLLLVAEEDDVFQTPRGLRLRAALNGTVAEFAACEAQGGQPLDETGVLSGSVAYAGPLCAPGSATLTGTIALVDAGGCALGVKARQARAAGARAMVVIGEDGLQTPTNTEGGNLGLPVIAVSPSDGGRLRAAARDGAATVEFPVARPWGGVRVWDIRDPAQPVRRALFRTENAERFPPPGPGYYTLHNPLAVGRYALFAWYADGVRLVDLTNPDDPREVAAFVPPAAPDRQGFFPISADVWGVALSGDIVLASDINSGLYLLRLSGIPLAP